MAIPASTELKAAARRRAPKAEHLSMQYPDLLSSEHPHFWVAAYLRDLAEHLALRHLTLKLYKTLDNITRLSLCASTQYIDASVNNSLRNAQRDGLLLYAWPGTKLFINHQARH